MAAAQRRQRWARSRWGRRSMGSGTAAGRRVMVPWGDAGFDFASLNADGHTIMQRSIEWAAGLGSGGGRTRSRRQLRLRDAVCQHAGQRLEASRSGTQVTLAKDGTLNSITAYIENRHGKVRYAIYSDSGGEPGSLIVETDVQTSEWQDDWKTISVPPTPLTAGTYWLALSFEKCNPEVLLRGQRRQDYAMCNK